VATTKNFILTILLSCFGKMDVTLWILPNSNARRGRLHNIKLSLSDRLGSVSLVLELLCRILRTFGLVNLLQLCLTRHRRRKKSAVFCSMTAVAVFLSFVRTGTGTDTLRTIYAYFLGFKRSNSLFHSKKTNLYSSMCVCV
jgi:hypothetical protein